MARKFAAFLLFLALTLAMTWPQAQHLSSRVHDSDDPLLSIWRVSWIAHILPLSPLDLLNGNIFYPETARSPIPMPCCSRALPPRR